MNRVVHSDVYRSSDSPEMLRYLPGYQCRKKLVTSRKCVEVTRRLVLVRKRTDFVRRGDVCNSKSIKVTSEPMACPIVETTIIPQFTSIEMLRKRTARTVIRIDRVTRRKSKRDDGAKAAIERERKNRTSWI